MSTPREQAGAGVTAALTAVDENVAALEGIRDRARISTAIRCSDHQGAVDTAMASGSSDLFAAGARAGLRAASTALLDLVGYGIDMGAINRALGAVHDVDPASLA